jgi:succinate dehydrogenase/fumarate reductase flavoprotein subunit
MKSNSSVPSYSWLGKPPKIDRFYDELNCDIAVIGAGIAGCSAAQAAAEAGARLICIEKFAAPTMHGTDIGAVGSKLQRAMGIDIDKALAARLIYQWGQSQANYKLIRTFIERSGEVMDCFIDLAEKNSLKVTINNFMTARTDWDNLEDRFKQFRTAHNFTPAEGSSQPYYRWEISYLINVLVKSAKEHGASFLFNTEAVQLLKSDDRVIGVIAKDKQGYIKINSPKGVILATGGITDNKEMLERWCPIALRADKVDNFPYGGNMGDGIKMGVWAGAAVTRCNPAPVIHPVNLSPLGPGIQTSWLTVNREGERFCCEVGYEPIVTNARMNAPGNVAWAVWDRNYKALALKQEPNKFSSSVDNLDTAVEDAVAAGEYIKAASLEELADRLNIPAYNLLKTAERYNGWCAKGFDEDFGVPERFLCPVKEGPFYATKVNAWLLNLPHGLHMDHNSQVLTEADEPIEGLFAVGNVQGDFFANSYPVTVPGANHGRSATFGRLVGRALAKGKTISEV